MPSHPDPDCPNRLRLYIQLLSSDKKLPVIEQGIDQFQYLIVMAICIFITAPLELLLGARVYRQPLRLLKTLSATVAIFAAWDAIAIARGHWWFTSSYVTGVRLPFEIPLEEICFFLVIPICVILTFEVVKKIDRNA